MKSFISFIALMMFVGSLVGGCEDTTNPVVPEQSLQVDDVTNKAIREDIGGYAVCRWFWYTLDPDHQSVLQACGVENPVHYMELRFSKHAEWTGTKVTDAAGGIHEKREYPWKDCWGVPWALEEGTSTNVRYYHHDGYLATNTWHDEYILTYQLDDTIKVKATYKYHMTESGDGPPPEVEKGSLKVQCIK